jgi:hypothetical protein
VGTACEIAGAQRLDDFWTVAGAILSSFAPSKSASLPAKPPGQAADLTVSMAAYNRPREQGQDALVD